MQPSLSKWIEWVWEDGYKDLDDSSIDHVWKLMKEGYICGELCRLNDNDEEAWGWWRRRNAETAKAG